MAKQKTLCEQCDGSFDGTPSGWAKHITTNKHLGSKPLPGGGLPDELRARMGLQEDIEAAPGEPTNDPDNEAGRELLVKGMKDILNGEATAADVLGSLVDAGHLPDEGKSDLNEDPELKVVKPTVARVSGEPEPEPGPIYEKHLFSTALDERPESLLIEEFRPFDFPVFDEHDAMNVGDVALDKAAAEVDVAKFKRYVRHGELHNLKLLPKYQSQLAAAEALLAAIQEAEVDIEKCREGLYAEHYQRVARYWDEVHAETLKRTDIRLKDVRLITEGASVIVTFGSYVRVDGPKGIYGKDAERELAPAEVSTTIGSETMLPSTAMGVGTFLTEAGRYADEFNRVVGL